MRSTSLYLGVIFLAMLARAGSGYVDSSPTLGNIVYVSPNIALVEVDKVDQQQQVLVFRKVTDLRGTQVPERLTQVIKDNRNPQLASAILTWAQPKKTAICFISGSTSLIFTGSVWYSAGAGSPGYWRLTRARPELALAYIGTVEKLRQAVTAIAAKKQFIITAVSHNNRGPDEYDNAAFQHNYMRGPLPPLWRLKVSLDMPGLTISISDDPKNSTWIVGRGAGSADDVPPFITALRDNDARVRADAADELRLLGKEARSAILALEAALIDSEPSVRIRAAAALERIDPGNPQAYETLIAIAKDGLAPRRSAVEALGDMGAAARKAVPLLRLLLEDKDNALRASAVESLGLIGADAQNAVPDLIHLIDDNELAAAAVDALGRIGGHARAAIPRLVAAIRGDRPELRWVSAVSLIRIDPSAAEPAIPVLIESLKSPDDHMRWDARRCFLALGPTLEKAIPALLKLLDEPEDFVQFNAALVLGTLGPKLRESTPLFMEMARSKDRARRLHAIYLLRSTGPDARAAVPILQTSLSDPDGEIQSGAREALKAINR